MKATFTNLKLKVSTETKSLKIADNLDEIQVLQYLPIQDKYDLVMITLQNAFENNIYNELKIDYFFHLYLVYMYTNIGFTDKQKENPEKIYDVLTSNGIMDKIISLIPESEYNYLYDMTSKMAEVLTENHNKTANALRDIVNNLPIQADQFKDIMENFDPQKFQSVIDFATAANGGRDIFTNLPVE